jgi:putative transposase
MLYLMLRREGWRANHKTSRGTIPRRRIIPAPPAALQTAEPSASGTRATSDGNQTWAVDFIHDSLIGGGHFTAFAVLDQWSRESLAIEVNVSLTGERVTRVLERLRTTRGLPIDFRPP